LAFLLAVGQRVQLGLSQQHGDVALLLAVPKNGARFPERQGPTLRDPGFLVLRLRGVSKKLDLIG
jgi:hypothetical protein